MARDKHKDDLFFNCSQDYEFDYVSGLYAEKEKVREFLKARCADRTINHMTHAEVYRLIKKKLGLPLPH